MDLELKTSCGTTVTLTCELPDSVRFDCFVPELGICKAVVDPRSDEIDVLEVRLPDGAPVELDDDSAVLEQAGDVCAVFEATLAQSKFTGPKSEGDDCRTLTAIADMALHETELRAAWESVPDDITHFVSNHAPGRMTRYDGRPNPLAACNLVLNAFITSTLVERAQAMAEAAVKRRQAQWIQARTHEDWQSARYAELDGEIDRAKEEGP